MSHRLGYALAALAIFTIEVVIALWVHDDLIRPHGGDALAVVLVYLVLRAITRIGTIGGAALALATAFAVETAQWAGLAARLGFRAHTIGETVLGSSFDLGDLIAYVIGAVAILVVETVRSRLRQQRL